MDIKDYMKLPYTRIIHEKEDESGHYYYGEILELDGCQSTGSTVEELYASLTEAMEGYIETKLEGGFDVPKPSCPDDFSGKFVIRLPKSLHRELSLKAEQEGVSLNQYVLYKLAK